MTAPDPSADVRDTADEWAELRALAAAATPGPWWQEGKTPNPYIYGMKRGGRPNGEGIVTAEYYSIRRNDDPAETGADAAFIAAANPATITRLLDILDAVRAERDALAAAVDRVRRRHPRGDEESGYLAPGLWCPTCGRERTDKGYGGCPDRSALIVPGKPLRAVLDGGAR